MSQPGEEAQRELERRALRNVRGLLDKMEDDEQVNRRGVVRLAIIAVVAAVICTALFVAWMSARNTGPSVNSVVIPPAPRPAAQ